MLSFSYQLIISVIVVNTVVYFWLSSKAKKSGNIYTYGIGTFVGTSIFTVVLYTIIYLGILFLIFNKKVTNKYSESPSSINTFVLIKPAKLFADIGEPTYIGSEVKGFSLQIGDTVTSTATFQQGDFVRGTEYYKVCYKGRSYWFVKDGVAKTMFYYTYEYQPLTFEVSAEKNVRYWKRAKSYMESYERYHDKTDIDHVVYNDTVMDVSWDTASHWGHLKVRRMLKGSKYIYVVSGGTGKGMEYCIIENVKDRFGNSPSNQNAFAYYILHGDFYIDSTKNQ